MVTQSQAPAAVEGGEIIISAQKIVPKGPPIILPNNETVFPLDIERRCESEITEERRDTSAPPFRHYSMLNIGDKITGKRFWGFSSEFLTNGDIVVGGRGRTSAHPGQELRISGTCFMEIIQGWRGDPIVQHPKNALLE